MERRSARQTERGSARDDTLMPLAVRVTTAAAMLEMSRSSVYELARTGVIPSIRLGGSVRIPLAALERLVDEQAIGRDAATWLRRPIVKDRLPIGRGSVGGDTRRPTGPAVAEKKHRAAKVEPAVDERGVARRVEL